MSYRKKISILKAFVFCFGLIIIGSFCFSYIYYNGSTGGYDQNTQPPGIQGNISMEILVTEGAGYFFQVHANVQTLLNMVELQDIKAIDYIELNELVKSSLNNIINTRMTFEELIKIAEETPYNLEVIEQLNHFDYELLLKEYGLNPFIFGTVQEYLEKGDITGTYKYAYGNFKEIEQLLLNIQVSIAENRLPGLTICWRLNELSAETSLFGSYIARIFKAIK
ncbi:MAG: hypothetical protein JSV88_19180 [Candidatus Aminicenantes bacterium]|nr:MAG: hypothetical protein JSV88_19180 [Candidatus Aminicenantes bacterium]